MGRDIKEGLDYFPVNVDMSAVGSSMHYLEQMYGQTPFNMYIKLLMRAYRKGYYIGDWQERDLKAYAASAKVSLDHARTCFEELLNEELFSADLFGKYRILTSAGVQKKFLNGAKRRTTIEIIAEYWLYPIPEDHHARQRIRVVDIGRRIVSEKAVLDRILQTPVVSLQTSGEVSLQPVNRNGISVNINPLSAGTPTKSIAGNSQRREEKSREEYLNIYNGGARNFDQDFEEEFQAEFDEQTEFNDQVEYYDQESEFLEEYPETTEPLPKIIPPSVVPEPPSDFPKELRFEWDKYGARPRTFETLWSAWTAAMHEGGTRESDRGKITFAWKTYGYETVLAGIIVTGDERWSSGASLTSYLAGTLKRKADRNSSSASKTEPDSIQRPNLLTPDKL